MAGEVVVADYGVGNLFSVFHALRHAGADPVLSSDPQRVARAERLVLPGVGAFGKVVAELNRHGLVDSVARFRSTGRPFLGICVGMQMLMESGSEFGEHRGLGYFRGGCDRIAAQADDGTRLRVPHIGWTELRRSAEVADARWEASVLGDLVPGRSAFYFVHSFAVRPTDPADVLAEVVYGGQRIVAAIERDNLTGVQFHPERSGLAGQKLLARFLAR